jgi:hypothetical protein
LFSSFRLSYHIDSVLIPLGADPKTAFLCIAFIYLSLLNVLFAVYPTSLVLFNIETNISHALPQMPKYYNSACWMTYVDGDIFVCGDDNFCQGYNITYATWSSVPSPFVQNYVQVAVILLNGRPYVFGGQSANGLTVNTVYAYYANGTWGTRAPMPLPLRGVGAAALINSTSVALIHRTPVTHVVRNSSSVASTSGPMYFDV